MDLNNETILTKYKPLSPWAYFGYNILFSIPVIGFILLIVFIILIEETMLDPFL